jgi:hypothetical protein
MKTNKLYQLKAFVYLVLAFGILYNYKNTKNQQIRQCEKEIENHYIGIVDSVVTRYVKESHFYLKGDVSKHFLRQHGALWLMKGDSIIKVQGESRYIIHKVTINKDSILILYFDCNEKIRK